MRAFESSIFRPRRLPIVAPLAAVALALAPSTTGEGPVATRASAPDPVWTDTIAARLRADALAPMDGGDHFTASTGTLRARFDDSGVAIAVGSDTIVVRSTGWGRGAATNVPLDHTPRLGACDGDRVDAFGACVRRIEFGGAAREWWTAHDDGLEQGWDVESRPAGEGPLAFAVAVDGAVVDGTADALSLFADGGAEVQIAALAASDATGAPLPASFVVDPDGFRVLVDDAGATYPITIDPLYTTPSWTTAAPPGDDSFSLTLAMVGDVNDDGFGDVAVGSRAFGGGYGRVYLYPGGEAGLAATASQSWTGTTPTSQFGAAVAPGGDINRDGVADLLITGSDVSNLGTVHVYYGSAAGPSPTPSVTLGGASSYFGDEIAADDVNGDGYDDVIVAAYDMDSYKGRVYVIPSGPSGPSMLTYTTRVGPVASAYLGYSLATGDVNGDGYADVMAGAPGNEQAFVYTGGPTGLGSNPTTTLNGSTTWFGNDIDNAGDVNGDGYDDVIVGTAATSSGRAYVYNGTSAGTVAIASATLAPPVAGFNHFGRAVTGAGDVDGDGYGDVVVTANNYDPYTARAWVYRGASTGLQTTPTAELGADAAPDGWFGRTLDGGSDLDNDGYDDLVVGILRASQLAVFYGSPAALGPPIDLLISHEPTNASLGIDTARAGDLNGDGYADVVIGAPGWHDDTGRAYVFLGSPTGLPATASTALSGEAPGDRFGSAVATAGDIDGDLFDDLVVGAPGNTAFTGRIYTYRGGSAGLAASPWQTLSGFAAASYFGTSVSGGGDLNGDGFGDVLAGAPRAATSAGRGYAFLGTSTGLNPIPATSVFGTSSAQLGSYVLIVGDVNGDGFDDALFGGFAKHEVYHGSATGLGATPRTTLTSGPVTGQGDVNGDGRADVVVGAPGNNRASLFLGLSTGLSAAASTIVTGPSNSSFGRGVAIVGDLDADGYDDVAVGAPDADANAGRTYVYRGSPAGLVTTSPTILTGPSRYATFGYDVSGPGDVDGDGFADVLVGSPGCAHGGGCAYLYAGDVDLDNDGALSDQDCNDADATVFPGATEKCNGHDDDCDGTSDEPDATDAATWYADADSDGFGNLGAPTKACSRPTGFGTDTTDCDDTDATVSPADPEICNGHDDDCDGTSDEPDATDAATWYADVDGDGFGNLGGPTKACSRPTGFGTDTTDCDDTDDTVSPADPELCNGHDDDCDSTSDEPEAVDAPTWYADADGDTFGDLGAPTKACSPPTGFGIDATDCDDTDASVSPADPELCNGHDDDCDSTSDEPDAVDAATWYADVDGDTFGDLDAPTKACSRPTGFGTDTSDCDDADATVSPADPEVCNGHDDDCDGTSDEPDATDAATWYADVDGDTFGDPDAPTKACSRPTGFGTDTSDCDDTDATVSPADPELCNGHDDDCDGTSDEPDATDAATWYADADGDGFGDVAASTKACTPPADAVADMTDCDDADATVSPAEPEVCNGTDDNCDGTPDAADCEPPPEGCGCRSPGVPNGPYVLVALLGLLLRRRPRRASSVDGARALR